LWATFVNAKINVVMRIRFNEYFKDNGLNVVAVLRGTTDVKAVIPTVLQAILFIERQNIPGILRTLKGMEEMSSISTLTAARLKFQKISRVSKLSA